MQLDKQYKMTKGQNDEKQTGCFGWMIRTKQSANERWAKARNSFRKRFNRDNNKPDTADELLNDTGTPDMVMTKVPMVPRHNGRATPPEPAVEDISNATGVPVVKSIQSGADIQTVNGKYIDRDGNGEPDYYQVRLFLLGVFNKARQKYDVITKEPTPSSGVDTIVQEDTLSLSSSVISALAEAAVSESLSKIVTEQNGNQSARTGIAAPRTVSEVLENLNIDPNIGNMEPTCSGLPPCST